MTEKPSSIRTLVYNINNKKEAERGQSGRPTTQEEATANAACLGITGGRD
jgi:hypothetical protein